jgi:hypothetical protein
MLSVGLVDWVVEEALGTLVTSLLVLVLHVVFGYLVSLLELWKVEV